MPRAPFQVLVIPYRHVPDGGIVYAIFKRVAASGGFWQGIAGGGEDDETPLEAARREAFEEAGIAPDNLFVPLDSFCTVPVTAVERGFLWGNSVLVLPEHAFGVRLADDQIQLSPEHEQFAWLTYDDAWAALKWDSNRNALWELDYRLRHRRDT